MGFLKWWLRIVGSLYVLEGGGITAMVAFAPSDFAAIWASAPAETLDEVTVRSAMLAGLPAVLTWLLLGILMWIYSRDPKHARVLVITVVCWELLVWLPTDLVASQSGFELGRSAALLAVHIAIGLTGIFGLRRAANA